MRVLLIGDSPYLHTGISRVVRNLVRGLDEAGHEVFLGSWGWDINMYPKNEENKWIYTDKKTGKDHVAFPLLKKPEEQLKITYSILSQIKCDLLITLGDYWDFTGFEMLRPKLNYSFKWIAYLTIESTPINESYHSFVNQIDVVVTPSKFGKEVVEKTGKECHYIPFGIDHDRFYRLDDKVIKKERKKRDLKDKVRFINVCKNIHRKNIPAFLEAIKIAHEKDNRIVGYLHTDVMMRNNKQINVENLIKRFGVEDIISVPKKNLTMNIGYSDEELNVEYNCSDAVVCTSVAEGFGLPLVEGQACGNTPIAPSCSAMNELVQHGIPVDCQMFFATLEHEVGIINVKDLSDKMLMFANNDHSVNENILFSKGFSNENMNKELKELIDNLNSEVVLPVEVL